MAQRRQSDNREADDSVEVRFTVLLDAPARQHLENVLAGVTASGDTITPETLVRGYCQAAGEDALEQLVGRADYPTKTEARQRLLRRLVALVFNGQMPPARVVAGLFHLPPRSGTTLVANTTARYYTELAAAREAATAAALRASCVLVEDAVAGERTYRFRCAEPGIVAHLRELLDQGHAAAHPITADTDAVATYVVHDSALAVLADVLGVEAETFIAAPAHAAASAKRASSRRGRPAKPKP